MNYLHLNGSGKKEIWHVDTNYKQQFTNLSAWLWLHAPDFCLDWSDKGPMLVYTAAQSLHTHIFSYLRFVPMGCSEECLVKVMESKWAFWHCRQQESPKKHPWLGFPMWFLQSGFRRFALGSHSVPLAGETPHLQTPLGYRCLTETTLVSVRHSPQALKQRIYSEGNSLHATRLCKCRAKSQSASSALKPFRPSNSSFNCCTDPC